MLIIYYNRFQPFIQWRSRPEVMFGSDSGVADLLFNGLFLSEIGPVGTVCLPDGGSKPEVVYIAHYLLDTWFTEKF